YRQGAGANRAIVTKNLTLNFTCVVDVELNAVSRENAGITDLTTRLGIERRGIEHHNTLLPGLQRINLRTVQVQGRDATGCLQLLVAGKLSGHPAIGNVFGLFELAGRPRVLTLTLHSGVEAVKVDIDLTLAADISSKVNREPVGVVQREQGLAIQRTAGLDIGQRAVKNRHAVL